MNHARAVALAILVAATMLTGCHSKTGGGTPEPSLPADETVLAQFVDDEKRLDATQLATALGAGADLGRAAEGIRSEWDAARRRALKSLGPNGLVRPAARSATVPTFVGAPRADRSPHSGVVLAEFDFASMAWSTWSLGLLYLGNDASGTVDHGPSTSGDVTSTGSTTVIAAKRGPAASVKLTVTRTLTSKAGWSVSQAATVELTLPLCPDQAGVVAFDMSLQLKTTGSVGNGATSSVADTLAGHTIATVNDDANLASVAISGSYDHTVSAQGNGLAIPAGQSGTSVVVSDAGVTGKGHGDVTDAQVNEARNYGATLLRLAGSLATARAGDFYEKGYCTEIQVSPDDGPTQVAVGATQPFGVKVRHKWDNVELTDRITARLDGLKSVSPTGRTATPTTLSYVAPNEKNKKATIHIESRSRRGVAVKGVAVKTPGGYAIHETFTESYTVHKDGVSCDSPYGPWHLPHTSPESGWTTYNEYTDITLDPTTGTGTVRGEVNDLGNEGAFLKGTFSGTAKIVPDGDGYLITIEATNQMESRTGGKSGGGPLENLLHRKITNSWTQQLHLIAATAEECH